MLDVLPGAVSPEPCLEEVEDAAFLYLERFFLIGILWHFLTLPVLGGTEPLEHPAPGHGLEDGVQAVGVYPPPAIGQVRHKFREVLEYLAYSLLSGALLPLQFQSVIIDLPDVLGLPVGILSGQFEPHLEQPFGKLPAVAQEVEVRVVRVVPWIRHRAPVFVPLPVQEPHLAMLLPVLLDPDGLLLHQEGIMVIGALGLPDPDHTAFLDEPLELPAVPDLLPNR